MRVLAIDTALTACSAAVLDTTSGNEGGIVAGESVSMSRGHAEALMPLIARVMEASGMAVGDLDRLVVTTGPGSFTGLRVGLSAARGLGVATRIPVVGVSTLSAYAAPYFRAAGEAPIIAVIDARHSQVYLQVFDPSGATLVEPRLARLSEAVNTAAKAPARIVGSAAKAVVDALPDAAPDPVGVDGREAPDIGWVARIGTTLAEATAPPKPQYLRAADAQPHAVSLPRR